MDADEREICAFLKSWPGEFVGMREINRRAGGKWRFRENPNWAVAGILRLVEKGLVEDDSSGHYRLIPQPKKSKKKWVSPQIRAILKKSDKVFDLPEEEEP